MCPDASAQVRLLCELVCGCSTVVGLLIRPLKADVLTCAIGKHRLPIEIHFSDAKRLLLSLAGHRMPFRDMWRSLRL